MVMFNLHKYSTYKSDRTVYMYSSLCLDSKEPPKDRFGALYASPLGNLRRFSSQFARIGQSWLDSAMIATVGEVDGY